MSLDATNWAWRADLFEKKGGCRILYKRLVLLSLADRAGEDHCCFPSMKRLEKDTGIERKTVLKIIAELIDDHLIFDTGERKGRTKKVKVYKLIGIYGRETVPLEGQLLGENISETVPTTEQSQNWNSSNNGTYNSPNNGMSNSPNNGTQNLPKESPIESKNKKDWLCLKKLQHEIFLTDENLDFEQIVKSKWAEREKRAFEIYNAGRDICDDLMNYHFADWLINAYYTKYEGRPDYNSTNKQNRTSLKHVGLSQNQIFAFAAKLAHHPEVAGKIGTPGESFENLASRLAKKLSDPIEAKKLEPYLKQVGFKGELKGEAA